LVIAISQKGMHGTRVLAGTALQTELDDRAAIFVVLDVLVNVTFDGWVGSSFHCD
jgi:hypothetical protein